VPGRQQGPSALCGGAAPDYHEEDGHSTASSTTQLPSQHPLRQHLRGHRDGGTDLSTVPPTPLNHRLHLL